jgi:squalene monooxygenase
MAITPEFSKAQAERRRLHHEADVVVVGAGVFGCAIATTLARQGRSVILLERSMKEPDRIVGELLQPGGVSTLGKLGLLNCLEDIDAVRVKGYDVVYFGEEVIIPYPAIGSAATGMYGRPIEEKGTRPEGWSFHHGRFIRRLRETCKQEPNITIFETTVTDTRKADNNEQVLGVVSQTTDPDTGKKKNDYFFAGLTIIADGYASTFRKQYIKRAPIVKSKFYALELIDCPLPAPNHGTVILGDAAPVLLYQIGTHETRALIDVPDNLPFASFKNGGVKGYIKDTVIPSLPPKTQASVSKALEEGKLRSMPNSWLPPSTQQTPGLLILGDAMNMRHPLTGGGMTVAFNDVLLLSYLLDPVLIPDLSDSKLVLQAAKDFHWQRKHLSSIINILAQALYALFAANDPQLKTLQLGCFQYFQQGGQCIDGPAGLLAGIIRRPLVLFYHFFAVAFLSIWVLMGRTMGGIMGIWKFPLVIVQSMQVFWKACVVIFPFIFSEIRS